jgi:hypothetical protein
LRLPRLLLVLDDSKSPRERPVLPQSLYKI